MSGGQIYTDADFLAALTQCRSPALRALVVRLDTLAAFVRNDAIDRHEAANELNVIGMSLLALASRREAA